MKSTIRAGAAREVIRIPDGFFPYHSFNGRVLSAFHDDVCVRAVMIENESDSIMFVSVDTGDITDKWLPVISGLSGVKEDHIFLTATHTHEAPYIDRTIPENIRDTEKTEQFVENFKDALRAAVCGAKESLRQARAGFGIGTCNANVNRDVRADDGSFFTGINPHGVSDHNVYVLKLEDMDKKPIAFINNYAVHSSIMLFSDAFEGGMMLSSDLAGAAMCHVERLTGAVSLFTMAPAADQNPLMTSSRMERSGGEVNITDEGAEGFALVRGLGMLLGDEIVYVGKNIGKMTDSADIKAACSVVRAPGQKKPEQHPGDPLPADFIYEDGDPLDIRLGVIALADTAFAGIAGEIMTSTGMDIRKVLLSAGYSNAMVMTQCNGSNSYMGDDEAYDLHKFPAMASYAKKGISGILTEGIAGLCGKM